jgi:hypothetical protein
MGFTDRVKESERKPCSHSTSTCEPQWVSRSEPKSKPSLECGRTARAGGSDWLHRAGYFLPCAYLPVWHS